jgi:hypothetical protein
LRNGTTDFAAVVSRFTNSFVAYDASLLAVVVVMAVMSCQIAEYRIMRLLFVIMVLMAVAVFMPG